MKDGSSIYKLNISKNRLSSEIGPLLRNYLATTHDLAELYLHWNNLGVIGGRAVAEGLMENIYLKVLDISYNSIGTGNNNS